MIRSHHVRFRRLATLLGVAGAFALACGPDQPTSVVRGNGGSGDDEIATGAASGSAIREPAGSDAPAARAPRHLSETGLYAADGSVDPRNLAFSPQYPLWSDGATKSRWIHLPEGTTIDVSDVDWWRFPSGTRIWKEFAWDGRKVETRMIWKAGDEWVFASYVWSDDQTDATLAPEAGVPGVFEFAPGRWHSIPGLVDCNACHRSSRAVVLGFNALQLSDDRDPLAPHAERLRPGMVTLRSLLDADRLRPRRPELVEHPPRIREVDPTARAALGYLSANCGGCHNPTGPLARLEMNLSHDAAGPPDAPEPARRTTVGVSGRFVVPGVAPDSSRIVLPGIPGRSAIFHRMGSRRPSSQMPPLGTVTVDDEGLGLVKRWIEELGAPPASR